MIIKESVQTKIRWLIISFTIAISLFFIGLLIVYAWVVEDNIFNRMVSEEARFIEQQFHESGEVVKPRVPFMFLYHEWKDLPEHIRALRQQSPERIEFPLNNGGTIHIKELQLGNTSRLLSANVSSYEISKDYLPKLIPWMLLVLVFVVLSAFVLARYLARSVVDPLQRITSTVVNNSSQPLKFDAVFSEDEIGYLAKTITNSFNQLHAALQRESDFSRDISHELRTPVAVLKMGVGRISSQEPVDDASLSRVKSAVIEIEQSVDVLLALSRKESVKIESLCLLKETEHCIVNHFALSRVKNAELDIDILATYRVNCNKNLLHMLLNNLINNVVNHASIIALQVSLTGNQLEVKNPVEIPPPDDIFSHNVKAPGSPGMGQGLHLVKRICRECGWRVSITPNVNFFIISITLS